jgi:hypothetical protein
LLLRPVAFELLVVEIQGAHDSTIGTIRGPRPFSPQSATHQIASRSWSGERLASSGCGPRRNWIGPCSSRRLLPSRGS